MMKVLIFILSILTCYPIFSQNIEPVYKPSFENKVQDSDTRYISMRIIPSKKVKDSSFFTGTPSEIALYTIFSVVVNEGKVVYDNYSNGKISRESYVNYLKKTDRDSTVLAGEQQCYKNKFHIYIGLDKAKNEKYIIVDSNNNLDFSDDKTYTFPLEDYNKKSWHLINDSLTIYPQIDISCSAEEKHIPNKISVALHPYDAYDGKDSYSSEDEYRMNVRLATCHYKQAILNINNKEIIINESDNRHSFIPQNRISNISTFSLFHTQDSIYPPTSRIGDTLVIVDRKIVLEKEKNNLYIKDLGYSVDSGKVGDFLPILYSKSLEDEDINISELTKGKFVFIDFWGSWCAPCIGSLPKLVELYDKIKVRNDVIMIGIALENEKDILKLRQVISENHISWQNMWSNYSNAKLLSSPFKKLNIETYPTYIVVDNTGKIVYKKSNSLKIDEAIEFFLNLIDK